MPKPKQIAWAEIKSVWPTLTREEQAAVVQICRQEGMTVPTTAEAVGAKTRLIQCRRADVRVFELAGTLPELEGLVIDREAIVSSEMDRRDRLVIGRDARSAITREAVTTGVLAEIKKTLAEHSAAVEKEIVASRKAILDQKQKVKTNKVYRGTEAAIQSISDLHHCRNIPGVVDEATTAAALTKYRTTCNELTTRQRQHADVDELFIFINGDNLHGIANFKSQAREVTGSMSYQIWKTAELFIDHINLQRVMYKKITVVCTGGNHGRKAKDDDLLTENSEFELGRMIQFYFANSEDVEVKVAYNNFYIVQEVLGRPILVTHGDQVAGGGDPQTITNAVKRWEDVCPETFTDAFIGHFHRLLLLSLPTKTNETKGRYIFVNGTAAKDDDYLSTKGASPSLAWWFTFCNGKRMTALYPVDLYE